MRASGTRIVVLGKPPRPGASKTRLAAELGAARTARLARAFLTDTWTAVSAWVSADPELDLVLAVSAPYEEYPLQVPTPTMIRQGEGDLGRRMATLAAGALDQRKHVLLLGTDSPGLPVDHLDRAVIMLAAHDIVLGPCTDGGFWCLGVRGGHPTLWGNTWLDDLDWNRSDTRAQVIARAERIGLSVGLAAEWMDVDVAADLTPLRALIEGDPSPAPETLLALDEPPDHDLISVVIPTLNESVRLDDAIEALEQQSGRFEIIVADGGSLDRSDERAAARGVVVVVSPMGRGRQLIAGAGMATAPVLLFLHADTRLPPDASRLIHAALEGGAEAGAFVIHTVPDPTLRNRAGPLLRLADLRSHWTRHPYGDQALFVTREAYDDVGGFKPLPIMEDHDLAVRLAKRRPLARIKTPVTVSGRRIQRHPIRSALLMRLIPPLYWIGVNPHRLARWYHGR